MPRAKSIAAQFRAAKRKGRPFIQAAEIDGAVSWPFIAFVPGKLVCKIDGEMNPRALRELADYMEHENERYKEKAHRAVATRKKAGAVQKRVARTHGKAPR